MTDRYEFISHSYTGDRRFLLTEILEAFPTASAHLSRRGQRVPYDLKDEQDIRDLLYAIIKCIFPDARLEEYTRVHAGSAKRIDIVIPGISTLIEVKLVRNSRHAKRVADELRVDFESYHIHEHCKQIWAYIWDPQRLLIDRGSFIRDLRGMRSKDGRSFRVEVYVKP